MLIFFFQNLFEERNSEKRNLYSILALISRVKPDMHCASYFFPARTTGLYNKTFSDFTASPIGTIDITLNSFSIVCNSVLSSVKLLRVVLNPFCVFTLFQLKYLVRTERENEVEARFQSYRVFF